MSLTVTAVRRRRWLIVLGLIVVSIGAVYAGKGLILRGVAGYLVVNEPLEQATAVVVLGGGVPLRALEAARVYQAGWAPRVVVTRAKRQAEFYLLERLVGPIREERDYNRAILLAVGVPSAAIVMMDDEVENTRQELDLVFRGVGPVPTAPVILVTSKVHTRRVHLIWKRVSGDAVKAIVRGATEDPFDAQQWWRERRHALAVVREYLGLFNLWLAFPMG